MLFDARRDRRALDRSDRGALDELFDDYAAELDPDLTGVRIRVERAYYFYDAVAPDVRAAVERAIGQLEELAATVLEVEIDDRDLGRLRRGFLFCSTARANAIRACCERAAPTTSGRHAA